MDDNELKELFSAFDEVSAPDSMKTAAFDSIMAIAGQGAVLAAQSFDSEAGVEPDVNQAQDTISEPSFSAKRGKKRLRAKWRAFRVAAVAACLALALTGGAAYAYYTPTSFILITQGETTVELPVNMLGITLAGSGNDAGIEILNSVEYRGKSFEESVLIVTDSMKKANPDAPITVLKKTNAEVLALQVDGALLDEQAGDAGESSATDNQMSEDDQAAGGNSGLPALSSDTDADVESAPPEGWSAYGYQYIMPVSESSNDSGQAVSDDTGSGSTNEDVDPQPVDPVAPDDPQDDPIVPEPGPIPVDPEPEPIDDEPVEDEIIDPGIDDEGDEGEDDDSTRPPQRYGAQSDGNSVSAGDAAVDSVTDKQHTDL